MKIIQKGTFQIIVDDEDFDKVKDYDWRFSPDGYPRTTIDGERYFIHHYIFLINKIAYKGKTTDHINRNPLDNRKVNLRFVSHRENVANGEGKTNRKYSQYKGVSYDINMKRKKRWRALCEFDGKNYNVGRYLTEEEAGLAYNKKAKELWGECAFLNKIDKGEQNGISR